MEQVIKFIFDQFLKELCGEGERRIKREAFSAALQAVLGVRKLFILAYAVCFACFLAALSFFGLVYCLVEQWTAAVPRFTDPRLLACAGLFIGATGLLALSVRESRWADAFRLQERLADLDRAPPAGSGFNEADLMRLIDRVLEQRMAPKPAEPVPGSADAPSARATTPDAPPAPPKDGAT